MVANFFIDLINFFLYQVVLRVLPVNLPFFSIDQMNIILNSDLKSDLIYAFSGLGKIFPIGLILILLVVVIVAETLLFFFKLGSFFLNLLRGSGA